MVRMRISQRKRVSDAMQKETLMRFASILERQYTKGDFRAFGETIANLADYNLSLPVGRSLSLEAIIKLMPHQVRPEFERELHRQLLEDYDGEGNEIIHDKD
jgi:hypothetical protein